MKSKQPFYRLFTTAVEVVIKDEPSLHRLELQNPGDRVVWEAMFNTALREFLEQNHIQAETVTVGFRLQNPKKSPRWKICECGCQTIFIPPRRSRKWYDPKKCKENARRQTAARKEYMRKYRKAERDSWKEGVND